MYDRELECLQMVYAAADDYLTALADSRFCEEYGGIERFLVSLNMAVQAYKTEIGE